MKLLIYALIMAGMMSCTGVMAADTAVEDGGTGTISINGTIRTATCSISLSSKNVAFELSKSDINTAASGALLQTKELDVNISNCAGQKLAMTATASKPDNTSSISGMFESGDNDKALLYLVGLAEQSSVVSGGDTSTHSGYHLVNLDGSTGVSAVTITPDATSGQAVVKLDTLIVRNGTVSANNLGSQVVATYSYNFTYA
ncbi:hypothetical protein QDX91_004537 [Salmonella enterica]|nr:hypothetical protein [Salmonella enterica subsp. enterica serovar Sandiego]EEC0251896.1 hypothetical protein [Salmonella enterica subsp. enterica]EJW2129099.1 hypothetical protein [Salmonella enterica]EEE4266623.1 hypothetical protein [Salmonella enterica subsp. enterica serovar Sandiego]EKT1705031.1 hypothetical protein [Salmonella enterica]